MLIDQKSNNCFNLTQTFGFRRLSKCYVDAAEAAR
jgi:hypothetical protein